MKRYFEKTLVMALALTAGACAPLFSDMQGARLAGKGNLEFTPGYSFVGFARDGSRQGIANYLGFSAAYGLSKNVDLRFRFEHSWLKNSGVGEFGQLTYNVYGVGPKINLLRDRIALFLPIGYGAEMLQFQPTVLFTIPLIRGKIDFNPSVKHLASICDVCFDPLVAFNAGMAISSDVTKWAIRPEYGVLYNIGSPGHYSNFSIGISVNLSTF